MNELISIDFDCSVLMVGVAGAIARVNGVVLEMTMSGSLSTEQAFSKLLPSLIQWSDLNCADLFPK